MRSVYRLTLMNVWIHMESSGSIRLMQVCRRALMTAATCEKLGRLACYNATV